MSDITIIYGTNASEMTTILLRDMFLREASLEKQLKTGMNVVIKPNLVVAKPASEGATTHPEIVEGIIQFLQDLGIKTLTIAEGSWLGETTSRAFDRCGFSTLAKKYNVKLFDTKSDTVIKKTVCGLTLGLCEIFTKADFLINVPVLKGHCQTTLTCCLKNMKGCIPDSEKRRYHNIGLHKPIAAINTVIVPDLHVIDGICGDPTFEEGGKPVTANRILLGTDPVLLDSYVATLLGYEPGEIDYLRYAAEYGIGKMFNPTSTVRELQTEHRPKTNRAGESDIVRRWAKLIDEQNACSACYAALIYALNNSSSIPVKSSSEKIKIGQGFRGKQCTGIGVGNCTADCERCIQGCPPTASEIIAGLRTF